MFRRKDRKYITFTVPIKKELDKDKKFIYKIIFIDSVRFMSRSLSSLVDNLSEGLHNYNCPNCKRRLDYISTKDNLLIFKYIEYSKNHKSILIKI